jgi:hypothetical protein
MGTMADSTPAMMLRDFIIADGRAALFTGWDFKIGKLPSAPDRCIALIDQGGPAGFPHLLVDWPNIQVLVRSEKGGTGYLSSKLVMNKVRDIILGCPAHPTQFSELDGITERGQPVPLGFDDSDRHVWSYNVQCLVEPETNALTHRVSL